jgi:hypothetical protein
MWEKYSHIDISAHRWKNNFPQLLNVHCLSDIRQIEIQTAEPLLSGPSPFEVEISIAKLNKYRSPGNDQIPTEPTPAGGETLWSEINKLILLAIRTFF